MQRVSGKVEQVQKLELQMLGTFKRQKEKAKARWLVHSEEGVKGEFRERNGRPSRPCGLWNLSFASV